MKIDKIKIVNDFPQQYETFVIGSDQVWANYCTNGIDEVYYGNFPHGKSKIIGYAISGNIESLKENGNERLKNLCKNFSNIAFREKRISEYLRENIGFRSDVVLDPTLLLDREEWDKIIEKSSEKVDSNYVLTYFLNENFDKNVLNKGIKAFASHEGCRVVQLGETVKSPEGFVSLIKNAKYIITSSFHVTVFSLIYNKQVWALRTNNGKDIRYIDLLEMAGMMEDSDPDKLIFESAAAQMLEAVIDRCTGDIGVDYDGLICHVTHAKPQGQGIDECAVYGDYFYLEALMRLTNPEWEKFW